MSLTANTTTMGSPLLRASCHTLSQESAPLQPPFPSLGLKQTEKDPPKNTQKQRLSLTSSKRRKTSDKETFPADLTHAGHCTVAKISVSPCWSHIPVQLCPTAAREDRSWSSPRLPGMSCSRHCIATSWENTHNFLGWQQGSSAAFLAPPHRHTWELLHLGWAQYTVSLPAKCWRPSTTPGTRCSIWSSSGHTAACCFIKP